jgi:hypothetical protein
LSTKEDDYRAVCDICGRRFWFSELRKRWDGFYADEQCWEPYHEGNKAPEVLESHFVEVARPRLIVAADDAAKDTPVTADTSDTGLFYVRR